VGSAGDVNGDGYSDILVGAPGFTNGDAEEGMAFVWHGSSVGLGPSGNPSTANWKVEGGQALAYLGGAAASAGDVNGDGYSDVIVGQMAMTMVGQTKLGLVLLYSATFVSIAGLNIESNQAGAALADRWARRRCERRRL
jgi:hypothetical protein